VSVLIFETCSSSVVFLVLVNSVHSFLDERECSPQQLDSSILRVSEDLHSELLTREVDVAISFGITPERISWHSDTHRILKWQVSEHVKNLLLEIDSPHKRRQRLHP